MSTQTKTVNAGPVGLKPKGDYSSTATYTLLDCVKYNHDSWVCKAVNALGEAIEITGQTPQDGSQYWQALTDGGRAAYAEGETAKEKGNTAAEKAALADEKATLANSAAETANTAASRAEDAAGRTEAAIAKASRVNAYMVDYELKVTDHDGHTTSTNVKGEKGEGINYATMSDEQKNELAAKVIQQICSQNVIGPRYDAENRCINYDITNGVKYDETNRCIKLG